jgi:hypothetical protein
MFTSAFAHQVVAPASQGQPAVVRAPINLSVHLFLVQPALFNSFIVLIQLGLGVLILTRPTVRLGLVASVVWGLFVWYIGEGLGGLLGGQTSLLMGAPGAALLYAVLALAVLPKRKGREEDARPAYWLPIVWAVLWVGGAIYQLLPGQNSVSDLGTMLASNAGGAPGWMGWLDNHLGRGIDGLGHATNSMTGVHMTATQMAQMQTQGSSGWWFIPLLAGLQAAIGLAIFLPGLGRKLAVGGGIALSLVFWVVGQSLGGYSTGLATDPSTAPLFVLLGLACLGSVRLGFKGLMSKAEAGLTAALV